MIFTNMIKGISGGYLRPLWSSTLIVLSSIVLAAQTTTGVSPSARFRIGEKLSYNVSLEKFQNMAHLETHVVSRGKLGGRDVIEIRGRAKTFEFVSAAISLLDEDRTVFVDPETGIPLLIRQTLNQGAIPKEVVHNFLTTPSAGHDLLTLIYQIREAGGLGTFTLSENGETYVVSAMARKGNKKGEQKGERIKTEAGEFDTTVSWIQSAYFDSIGIKDLVINFSSDGQHLPVLMRFETSSGTYRAELAGVQMDAPETPPDTIPSPTPGPSQTPRPSPTPTPQRTPEPYVENLPLLPELSFSIGESLEYRITNTGRPVATIRFLAQERKLFQNRDSLKLTTMVTGVDPGNPAFVPGDEMSAQVNPETLAPFRFDAKFAGTLKEFNQIMIADPRTGLITFGSAEGVEAPVGTHSVLSLIYAMRSFNLSPSKTPSNPVNDTRVAVFWKDRANIFTLRPGAEEIITIGGEKLPAQLITIKTDIPQIDQLGFKVWLSTDTNRVPLRISIGPYQADLVTIPRTNPN